MEDQLVTNFFTSSLQGIVLWCFIIYTPMFIAIFWRCGLRLSSSKPFLRLADAGWPFDQMIRDAAEADVKNRSRKNGAGLDQFFPTARPEDIQRRQKWIIKGAAVLYPIFIIGTIASWLRDYA